MQEDAFWRPLEHVSGLEWIANAWAKWMDEFEN